MKLTRKILSILIILLGLAHVSFAFPIGDFDTDDIWFIGAGIALVFSGFLNLSSVQHCTRSLIGYLTFFSNLICLGLFLLARQVLQEPQVYVGIYLFLAATILSGIGFINWSKRSGQYTHPTKTETSTQPDTIQASKVVPMLRIFDKKKTEEFYINWLGFTVDWEHRFEENLPLYMQVSKGGIVIHLTEHHGDCSPGGKVYIECTGLREYHRQLLAKNYGYNRPGLDTASWSALCMTVIDPFGNQLMFNEKQ